MKITQHLYIDQQWDNPISNGDREAQLILAFGDIHNLENKNITSQVSSHFSNAIIAGCTTAGEIIDTEVYEHSLSLTALTFKSSQVSVVSASLGNMTNSELAQSLAAKIETKKLKYVLVLLSNIYATEFVSALQDSLPPNVVISGGLAGDGTHFKHTYVRHNNVIAENMAVICCFYGDKLAIKTSCEGGWIPFGPMRTITGAHENILTSIDQEPALDLYKKYLGKHADELPLSSLRFPISLHHDNSKLIRTILSVNEDDKSLFFAGDMPLGTTIQLLRTNYDGLISGAGRAAEAALFDIEYRPNSSLYLLISCVGRRMVLKNRTPEELEIIKEIAGPGAILAGFYSYGELSAPNKHLKCELHNQTMTITNIRELDA